jgi:DNA-binding transcriptional LysR family regulator
MQNLLTEKVEKHAGAQMRLRHIEVFNAVMLTGSVSAAARLINVTQPAVSRALAHAELQLGFALFRRVKGRLVPTTEAQTLYPHIERLFQQLDDVQRLAKGLKQGHDGQELQVLTVMALSYEVMPKALKAFCAKYPDIRVNLKALHTAQIVSALALGEADLGLAFGPLGHPSITQRSLALGRMVAVVPNAMLSKSMIKGRMLGLRELADLPVIGLDARDPIGMLLSQACREAGVGLQSTVTVQTYHAALALAHHGLGIALIDSCAGLSADPSRATVLALDTEIAVPVLALVHAQRPSSVAAEALGRCVQQALQEVAPA